MIKENFIKIYEESFKENWALPALTDYGKSKTFTFGDVPGKTRIIGTKNQEVWNLRKPNIEVCIVAGMIACYVIPKLLEVMKLF